MTDNEFFYDAIVVGIGHAGIESSLALARKGHKTLALSISLDNAGYLACNPSIGGTAKGHLVCEVDALGGEMGIAADKTLSQLRMLNASKGAAVHSLRAQVDKYRYSRYMKNILENTPNLSLRQGEVKELLVKDGRILGVETVLKLKYLAPVVVLACGVYLNSSIITGDVIENKGPSSFARSNYLADSLNKIGIQTRRFKTGTPARVKRNSINLDALEVQEGEDTPYSFSVMTKNADKKKRVCYLGYTNGQTHDVIRQNLKLSPKYAGLIHGAGARYCPSVEDKIVRFADKERHQFFLEPEGEDTQEMYVQGLSTGLPASVQIKMYRTIKGFENIEIMRDAYAIEYECINPLSLFPTLMSKDIAGLFFAGQINGTSGYEEAAAQGLVAGINAALFLEKKPPLILARENSYIGVLIDDLVTLGTDEPYRMMTSRAEFRLLLRQDNADLRLTQIGFDVGLVMNARYKKYKRKLADIKRALSLADTILPKDGTDKFFDLIGEPLSKNGMSVREIIKRNAVSVGNFCESFDVFAGISKESLTDVFTEIKYEGYLSRERRSAHEAKRLENMALSPDIDFMAIEGMRIEAKEKLSKIRPLSIGQAARISGVTPADINVLIIRTTKTAGNKSAE